MTGSLPHFWIAHSEAEACLPKAVPLGRTSVSQDPRQQPTSFVLRDVHTYHLPLCHLLSILDSSVFSIHSTWDMTAGPSLPWMTVVRPVHREDDYPFPPSQTIPLLICLWITPRLSCFCMFHRHFTCNMSSLSLQTGLASCSMLKPTFHASAQTRHQGVNEPSPLDHP